MLTAIGAGLTALVDYTQQTHQGTRISQQQGAANDTAQLVLWDPQAVTAIVPEQDLIVLDENDPNGWPTVNLLANPSFEGTYSGGVAPNWTVLGTPTGVTYASSTTAKYGSAAQSIALANVANGTNVSLYQTVTLPTNAQGVPLIALPFTFSLWLNSTAAWSNVTATLLLHWYNAGGAALTSTAQTVTPALNSGGASGGWQRVSVTGPAPAGAASVHAAFSLITISGTNGGTALVDGAQLEYQTFGADYVTAAAIAANLLTNPEFAAPFISGLANGWAGYSGTGITYASSATAYVGATSQSVTLSNVASGVSVWFAQGVSSSASALYQYQFTLILSVITAAAGCTTSVQFDWYDASGNYLTSSVQAITLTATSGFAPYSVTATAPAGAATMHVTFQATTTSGTNALSVLLGAASLAVINAATTSATQTASAAGIYPTPYCDANQPGCHTDGLTSLPYRHLRLFGGYVRRITDDYSASPERLRTIEAADYGVMLTEALVTLVIQATQDSTAIAAAVTYILTSGGYLAGLDTSSQVASIGTVDGMTFTFSTLRDVLDSISNQTVASYWVDPYKVLHYQPALAVTAPYNLADQPDGITSFPMSALQVQADSTQSLTTKVVEGGTQLTSPLTYTGAGNGTTTAFTINGGNPVAQVDSCTDAGTAVAVGLASTNTYAQGYGALLDISSGVLTFQTAPASAAAVVVIFRYLAPVIIRTHNANAEASTGAIRRKVSSYSKHDEIITQQSAIDRANADMQQYSAGRPVITVTVDSPPAPTGTPLSPGQALLLTHAGAGFSQVAFQVQKVDTTWVGMRPDLPGAPSALRRVLNLGYCQPDVVIQLMQARAAQARNNVNITPGTVLNDVQSASDGWLFADSLAAPLVQNVGIWDGTSTWDGTATWG